MGDDATAKDTVLTDFDALVLALAATPEEGEWPKRDAVPEFIGFDPAAPVSDRSVWLVNWSEASKTGWFSVDPSAPPPVITPERAAELGFPVDQLQAGVRAMLEYEEGDDAGEVAAVFWAMAALVPVELVPPGELAALRERDAAYAMRNETMAALTAMRAERDHWIAEFKEANAHVAKQDDEITALHAKLAARPVGGVPETTKPSGYWDVLRYGNKAPVGLITKAALPFLVVLSLASPGLAQSGAYSDGYSAGSSAGTYDRWSTEPDASPRASYEIYDNRWRHDPPNYPTTTWQRGYTEGLRDAHDADVNHRATMEWLGSRR